MKEQVKHMTWQVKHMTWKVTGNYEQKRNNRDGRHSSMSRKRLEQEEEQQANTRH
jgi:hypothetical protein